MGVFQLNGRAALVTGAGTGLGAAVAEALGAAGAAVMVADTLEEAGRETALAVEKHGVRAAFRRTDVTCEADWQAVTEQAVAELGGFDILVNTADLTLPGLLIDVDPGELRAMLDVNVVGAVLGIRHAFRRMRPGGTPGQGGVVVNISSSPSSAGSDLAGHAASRAAIDRLTRTAAAESARFGYGVRVNCIYPGAAPSPDGEPEDSVGTPRRERLGDLNDLAHAVVFFASEASGFGPGRPVTG